MVDVGGVDARSDKFMERERSGILLRLMDFMGYTLINLTPADLSLLQNATLQRMTVLSSNYQGAEPALSVHKEFDHTDAQGRKIRFFGVYDGDDSRFLSAPAWLNAVVCPPDKINVLLYYADRKPDAETQSLLRKFDAVIANLRLPEGVPHFVPSAKGRRMAVLKVRDKGRIAGREIELNQQISGDPEMVERCWRELSDLSKREEEWKRTRYLRMTPEEFIKTYQKENP